MCLLIAWFETTRTFWYRSRCDRV